MDRRCLRLPPPSEGVDPAVFANHLMRHCQRLVESAREYDPLALIRRAFAAVQASPVCGRGGGSCSHPIQNL